MRTRGDFGLIASTSGRRSQIQLDQGLKTRRHSLPRTAKVWTFPSLTIDVTRKPRGSRMGKGQGSHEYFAARIHTGAMRFEIRGVPAKRARPVLHSLRQRRPLSTKVVH